MEAITIGLWVTGGLLVMVVLGMRVAFAAGLVDAPPARPRVMEAKPPPPTVRPTKGDA